MVLGHRHCRQHSYTVTHSILSCAFQLLSKPEYNKNYKIRVTMIWFERSNGSKIAVENGILPLTWISPGGRREQETST